MELTFSTWGTLDGVGPFARRRSVRRMAHAYGQVIDFRLVKPAETPAPDPMSYDRGGHPAPFHSPPGRILNTKA